MQIFLQLLILAVLLAIIGKSADMVVRSSLKMGKVWRARDFVVGFLLLGFTTSSPELMVGINSALSGAPQLSLGNLLGASITISTLIFGIAAMVSHDGLRVLNQIKPKQLAASSLMIAAPLLLLIDGRLSRTEGAAIVALYFVYLLLMRSGETIKNAVVNSTKNKKSIYIIGEFALGLIILILASRLIVQTAIPLADSLGVPLILVGLIILGIGTNLPEISLTLFANKFGHSQLIVGNLINSMAVNAAILGIVAIIHPIVVFESMQAILAGIFLVVSLILVNIFAGSRRRIFPAEGVVLVFIYIIYLVSQVLITF